MFSQRLWDFPQIAQFPSYSPETCRMVGGLAMAPRYENESHVFRENPCNSPSTVKQNAVQRLLTVAVGNSTLQTSVGSRCEAVALQSGRSGGPRSLCASLCAISEQTPRQQTSRWRPLSCVCRTQNFRAQASFFRFEQVCESESTAGRMNGADAPLTGVCRVCVCVCARWP